MKRSRLRILVFLTVLSAAVLMAAVLRNVSAAADEAMLEKLRDAAPVLALAAEAPQVSAVVLGDPAAAAALRELFFVEKCSEEVEKGSVYDLAVIAAASRYRTPEAKRSLVRKLCRQTLPSGGVVVIPAAWRELISSPCRLTSVAGTEGRYCFVTRQDCPAPELAELARRLKERVRESGLPPYPEGVFEAHFSGEDEESPAAPPLLLPERPLLPMPSRIWWGGAGVLALLLGCHVLLSQRSMKKAAHCYAVENGAALFLAGVGVLVTAASFQAEWEIDPVLLLPGFALPFLWLECKEELCRKTGYAGSGLLLAALLLLHFYGGEAWSKYLFFAALLPWLPGIGGSETRRTLLPFFTGCALGTAGAWFLCRHHAPPWSFFAAAWILRSWFLLKI